MPLQCSRACSVANQPTVAIPLAAISAPPLLSTLPGNGAVCSALLFFCSLVFVSCIPARPGDHNHYHQNHRSPSGQTVEPHSLVERPSQLAHDAKGWSLLKCSQRYVQHFGNLSFRRNIPESFETAPAHTETHFIIIRKKVVFDKNKCCAQYLVSKRDFLVLILGEFV